MVTSNPAATISASLSVNRLVDFQSNATNKRIPVGVGLVIYLFTARKQLHLRGARTTKRRNKPVHRARETLARSDR